MTVPSPSRDDLFEAPADDDPNCDIDREFWAAYLRDVHGFDSDVIEERPDPWLWNRAQEVAR